MTGKQHDFIVRLVSEKDTTSLSEAQQAFLPSVVDGTADLTPAQASRIIDALLACPRRPVEVTSTPDVPAGRYAVVTPEGITEFYKVDRPTEGRWAGYVFVKQQASDDLYPVKGARRDEVLGRIAVDPRAAMVRYGHELGACGNCGRTLTDEVSRAMGIGPDCAAKLGIERLSVEEVVAHTEHQRRDDLITEALGIAPGETLVIDVDLDAVEDTPSPSVTDVTIRREPKLGWRETKAAVKAQQSDAEKARGEWRARAGATGRIHTGELPGSTWEDIFGI